MIINHYIDDKIGDLKFHEIRFLEADNESIAQELIRQMIDMYPFSDLEIRYISEDPKAPVTIYVKWIGYKFEPWKEITLPIFKKAH